MSAFVPYRNAKGAIHNLSYAGGLSAERTIPLLVSPRVLYILQNLASLDVSLECRYAVDVAEGGYLRLTTDDSEYPDFLELVSDIGLQLRERQAGMGTVLNYREVLTAQVSNDNADAGTNILETQGPGTDEVWVIDSVRAVNATSSNIDVGIRVRLGSTSIQVKEQVAVAAGVSVYKEGPLHLSHDCALQVGFYNCQAGDDLYVQTCGYIMDLVQ